MNDNDGIIHEKYQNFKNNIEEVINSLLNLKLNEYEDEIKDLIKLENENLLFPELLLFLEIPKYITSNIDYTFHENKYTLIDSYKISINTLKGKIINKNIYKIMLHMLIFLLSKIEMIITENYPKTERGNLILTKNEEINQTYQILIQFLFLIENIYKEKIYDLNKILLFFDIIIIFISKNKVNDDKYIKFKNIILFDLLIEKYFGHFLSLLLNNKEDNNIDINTLFNYIIKALNSKELKTSFNRLILAKNKIIEKLISIILNNIDYNKNIDIYNKYKDNLINCFANIYKNNTDQFNFFEVLINQNKISFINLMNYKVRQSLIIKDLYIQNFYLELLHKLFSIEKNELNNIKTEEDYFIFNGYNSKMTFDLNEFSLNNTFIFFSFLLPKDIINLNSINFPLIYYHSKLTKEIPIKLYIKKENTNIYKLYLYQQKGDKKNKNICLDKLGNIQLDIKYLLAIKFSNKKIGIFMNQLAEKNEIYFEEVDSLDFDKDFLILKIGIDDIKEEFFKGLLGSFIIMKKVEKKKNDNINEIINNILDLKNLYKFFPLLLSDSSIYNFEEKIFFSSIKEEYRFNKIKNYLNKNSENFKFELYLTPEIMGLYYCMVSNNENQENYNLPEIPNITSDDKYKIIDMNISLAKNGINAECPRRLEIIQAL